MTKQVRPAKLELPLELWPSLNELLAMHRFARTSFRRMVRQAVAFTVHATKDELDAPYWEVVLHRRGPRLLDFDNLVGGAKALVDSFVRVGLLEGDNPKQVHVVYTQNIDSNKGITATFTGRKPVCTKKPKET